VTDPNPEKVARETVESKKAEKTWSRDEIVGAVRECVAESLALEAKNVELTSRLIDDLGADSLDFLDFIFTLERQFDVKLRNKGLDQLLRGDFSRSKLTDEGHLGPDDIAQIEQWMPALRGSPDRDKVTPQKLFSYITVESLVIMVEKRTGEG
jgi:acyl carrier protein